jgi:hypothetical protein
MAAPVSSASMVEIIAAEVEESLAILEQQTSTTRGSAEVRDVLETAQASCRNLQLEVAGLSPVTLKQQWQQTLQQFQRRLQAQQRTQLFARAPSREGQAVNQHQPPAHIHRQQSALAMLQQSNEELEQTAALGQETVAMLTSQTKQVEAMTETVRETNGLLTQAKSLLGKMLRPFRM